MSRLTRRMPFYTRAQKVPGCRSRNLSVRSMHFRTCMPKVPGSLTLVRMSISCALTHTQKASIFAPFLPFGIGRVFANAPSHARRKSLNTLRRVETFCPYAPSHAGSPSVYPVPPTARHSQCPPRENISARSHDSPAARGAKQINRLSRLSHHREGSRTARAITEERQPPLRRIRQHRPTYQRNRPIYQRK